MESLSGPIFEQSIFDKTINLETKIARKSRFRQSFSAQNGRFVQVFERLSLHKLGDLCNGTR